MAACGDTASRKFPQGEIVGQNVDLGHLLREQRGFEVLAHNWRTVKVAIVGGGVAGLSAAWKLSSENFNDFVLLELEREIGGTSQSGSGTPVGYPWGAHYLPVPFEENKELISLLDEMSLTAGRGPNGEVVVREEFLCREPEERIFYKGRWYEGLYLHAGASIEDRVELDRFNAELARWITWRDAKGRRAFTLPVSACSNDAEVTALDRISILEWLNQHGLNHS